MAEDFRLTAYCCGTCKHWKRGAVFGGKRQSASGFCRNIANETPRQMEGYEIGLATLDLAVCTNWEEGLVQATVRSDEPRCDHHTEEQA
jgi:hypothetical protein